jgi:hypothetical protein
MLDEIDSIAFPTSGLRLPQRRLTERSRPSLQRHVREPSICCETSRPTMVHILTLTH